MARQEMYCNFQMVGHANFKLGRRIKSIE